MAAITVLGGYTWLWFWLGKKAGPTINRLRRIGIDPGRYTELEQFVLDLTSEDRSHSIDPSRMAVLPEDMKEPAARLRLQITRDRQHALAVERGKRGY